jgi:putative acetyltransferase
VHIRPARAADERAARDLLTRAFADDGRVGELAAALAARPDTPVPALVAEVDGAPVGYVQLSRAWIDAKQRLVPALVLSPLGIAPTHQRRGIGRELCAAAVAQARDEGAPAVLLEGDPRYYEKLGWTRASSHGVRPPSGRIPDAAFRVVLLPAWQPWMTGQLVYNDTFWAFDLVGLRESSAGRDET